MGTDKLLDQMRRNPRDWAIADVEALCNQFGIKITPPRRGSHYKVRNAVSGEILSIPAHRPIKPVYIRKLLDLIDQLAMHPGSRS